MRKFLFASIGAAFLLLPGMAKADIIDPLHLFCSDCSGDNGSFNPFPSGGTVNDVTVDESGTHGGINATDFFLKVLIPINSLTPPIVSPQQFTGTLGANPFAGSTVAQSTANPAPGDSAFLFVPKVNGANNPSLEMDFLGLTTGNGSPPNSLNTFLDQTTHAGIDPNAIGFLVFTLDLGALLVPENGQPGVSPFDLSSLGSLPAGTWILGDACTSGTLAAGTCVDVTTATSAALFAKPSSVSIPLPGTAFLFLGGLGALGWLTRRRRPHTPAPMQA